MSNTELDHRLGRASLLFKYLLLRERCDVLAGAGAKRRAPEEREDRGTAVLSRHVRPSYLRQGDIAKGCCNSGKKELQASSEDARRQHVRKIRQKSRVDY